MKNLVTILFVILLAINAIVGVALSDYQMFNVVLNSVVLFFAIIFSLWINAKRLDSALSIILVTIVQIVTLIEFVLGLLSPAQIKDNWYLIAILCLVVLQGFIIYAVTTHSDESKL